MPHLSLDSCDYPTPAYSKSHTIIQHTARFASCSSLNAQSPSPSLQEKQHINKIKMMAVKPDGDNV